MGFGRCIAVFPIPIWIGLILAVGMLVGCQTPQPGLNDRIAAHVANIDSSGLNPDIAIPDLDVRAAIPHGWRPMGQDTSAIYVHQQWRSPEHNTGVGVAFIHMPLPMSAKTLVWLARTQYSQHNVTAHQPDPQMLGEWTDSLGREWFEGENAKYHIKGYVVTSGFDAWAVYSGYRLRSPPTQRDLNLAFRSMDSIVPLPLSVTVAQAK
jgi:hypothetical protein